KPLAETTYPPRTKQGRNHLMTIWAADLVFAIEQLEKLNAHRSDRFFGLLDMNRLASFAHSFGGATAIELARVDGRCKAALTQGPDGLPHVSSVKAPGNNCWPFLANVGRPESGEAPQFGVERFYVDERNEFTQRGITRADDAYLVATVVRDGRLHPFDLVVPG